MNTGDALAAMDVSRRDLIAPTLLRAIETLLGVFALACWLPLLHLVITGNLDLGRRFAALDGVLPDSPSRAAALAALSAILLAATAARIACAFLSERRTAALIGRAESTLAERLLRRHLQYGQAYFDAIHPGQTTRHLRRLPNRAAKLVPWFIRAGAVSLIVLLHAALMLWLSPALAAATAAAFLAYAFLVRSWAERAEQRLRADEDIDDETELNVRDIVDNFLLYRLHVPDDHTVRAFRERSDRRARLRVRRNSVSGLIDDLREGGQILLMLAFVLAAGAFVPAMTHGDVARFLVFFLVVRRVLRPLAVVQRLPGQWRAIRDDIAEAQTLLAADDKPLVTGGDTRLDRIARDISFAALTFAYPGREPALRDVTFTARPGELTVLVGANGSGKSTLLRLLLRLYEVPPGTIRIDGHDLRSLDLESLRRITGYAGADAMILNATLRENLTLGLGSVDDDSLWRAAEAAGLGSTIRALDGGFDHPVGAGGLQMSAGERQKLALARLLLRRASLLLLDEASSALDAAAETDWMRRVAAMAPGRVILLVTHRVASIPPDAHTIVLDGGRVVQDGLARDLQTAPGFFRDALAAAGRGD